MRTKIIAALLAVLTALGGLNLFQSIKRKINPAESESIVLVETDIREERVRVRAGEQIRVEVKNKVRNQIKVSLQSDDVVINESFSVDFGDDLIVNVSHADIEIVTGSSRKATVKVMLDARNMNRALKRFEEMNWRVFQRGGALHIEADEVRSRWNVDLDIEVYIEIPSQFNIEIETSHGDVELDDLTGSLTLTTSHGDVSLGTVTGDMILVRSSHGDIQAGALASDRVELQTSHADIDVGAVSSQSFAATTSHADVEVGTLSGQSSISTSHGDISVHLTGNDNASFKTEHGDVEVSVDSNIKADFDLRAEEVRVASSLGLKGTIEDDRVEGSTNGGGVTIKVRTTHGSVSIREH